MVRPHDFVVSLVDVDHDDKYFVGEHAAHLGKLTSANLSILPGFVVTTAAYFHFISENNLDTKIRHLLGAINYDHDASVSQISQYIKKLIMTSKIPEALVEEIRSHYEKIGGSSFSIRTNLISGDHEQPRMLEEKILEQTVGDAVLLDSIRSFWAALFSPGLIIHRNNRGIDHLKTGISATVQKAFVPDFSGKIFTFNKKTQDKSKITIELESGHNIDVDRKTHALTTRYSEDKPIVYVADNKIVDAFGSLAEAEAVMLAEMAEKIEEHLYFPQEISWAKNKNNFFVTGIQAI